MFCSIFHSVPSPRKRKEKENVRADSTSGSSPPLTFLMPALFGNVIMIRFSLKRATLAPRQRRRDGSFLSFFPPFFTFPSHALAKKAKELSKFTAIQNTTSAFEAYCFSHADINIHTSPVPLRAPLRNDERFFLWPAWLRVCSQKQNNGRRRGDDAKGRHSWLSRCSVAAIG